VTYSATFSSDRSVVVNGWGLPSFLLVVGCPLCVFFFFYLGIDAVSLGCGLLLERIPSCAGVVTGCDAVSLPSVLFLPFLGDRSS